MSRVRQKPDNRVLECKDKQWEDVKHGDDIVGFLFLKNCSYCCKENGFLQGRSRNPKLEIMVRVQE